MWSKRTLLNCVCLSLNYSPPLTQTAMKDMFSFLPGCELKSVNSIPSKDRGYNFLCHRSRPVVGPTRSHGQRVPEAFPPRIKQPERMPDHYHLVVKFWLHSSARLHSVVLRHRDYVFIVRVFARLLSVTTGRIYIVSPSPQHDAPFSQFGAEKAHELSIRSDAPRSNAVG
jgi:hypothetical protein